MGRKELQKIYNIHVTVVSWIRKKIKVKNYLSKLERGGANLTILGLSTKEIAPSGQKAAHIPQPIHRSSIVSAFPSSFNSLAPE